MSPPVSRDKVSKMAKVARSIPILVFLKRLRIISVNDMQFAIIPTTDMIAINDKCAFPKSIIVFVDSNKRNYF